MARGQGRTKVSMVAFGDIQSAIVSAVPRPLRVVLYRRMMMRIACAIARDDRLAALVTGESLAQVSSQTMENIATIDEAAKMPILRPLIGFNKNEIIDVAREIDTFPVSILPDQDCCSLFVPKHPVIHSNPKMVRKLESMLPVDDMVEEALGQVQTKKFTFPET